MGLINWVQDRWLDIWDGPVIGGEWYRDKRDKIFESAKDRSVPTTTNQTINKSTVAIEYNETNISYSPTYLFDRTGPAIRPRIVTFFPSPIPEVPERRLPTVTDNQEPFKTPIGQSITIQDALSSRQYGKLLHRPINKKELVVKAKVPKDPFTLSLEELSKEQEEKAKRLELWYKAQYLGILPFLDTLEYEKGTPNKKEKEKELKEINKVTIWDCAMLFVPETLKGFQGYQGLIFGVESLHKWAETYAISAGNAYQSTDCFCYPKITVNEDKISVDRKYGKKEDFPFASVSFGLLPRLMEVLGGDLFRDGEVVFNFDQWLKDNEQIFFDGEEIERETLDTDGKPIKEKDYERNKANDLKCKSLFDYWRLWLAGMSYRQGLDEFPMEVPKSLSDNTFEDEDGNIIDADGNIIDDEYENNVILQSRTEFDLWIAQCDDERLGKYPFEIQVTDSDFINVGEQGLTLKIPNISEALAELTVKTITQDAMIAALLEFCNRTLLEVEVSKKIQTETFYKVESLQDYFGFKVRQKNVQVPYLCNPLYEPDPNAPDTISKYLEATLIDIVIEECDEEITFEVNLASLIEAAKIIRAVHTEKLPGSAKEFVEKIKQEWQVSQSGLQAGVSTSQDNQNKKKDPFDEQLEHFENGFIQLLNISNKLNPYGKDKEYRPKVIRLKRGTSNE